MNSNKNLVFLGMMGSGKSSIGKLVSKELNLPFIDIDSLIVENAEMSISQIFEKRGEIYFRNLEEKITLRSLKEIKSVIALGGGAFINDKIRKRERNLVSQEAPIAESQNRLLPNRLPSTT